MKYWLLAIISVQVMAADGTSKLLATGESNLELDKAIQVQKQLTLNDVFAVQAYGQMRALGVNDKDINKFFDHVFAEDFKTALAVFPSDTKNTKLNRLLSATKIYLFWKLDLSQNFVHSWVNEASSYPFLNSELGIALDQLISKDASAWLIKKAIVLDKKDKAYIDAIAHYQSKFNYSLQAYRNLRKGSKSLEWIKFLPKLDPLRIKLSESVILQFAKEGKLADAAKVLKEVVEPALKNEKDIEKIANHHLMLARLLYQAAAYDASLEYYSLIPDESRRYLKSQVESLWIELRQNNLPRIKGKLASLELDVFNDTFNPEVYLVSAMASLKLCQFKDIDAAFKSFVRVNQKFIKEIDVNLASDTPKVVSTKDFYIRLLTRAKILRLKEIATLSKFNRDNDIDILNSYITSAATYKVSEAKRSWSNRKKVLEATIRRLRFVKVEYLSKMRRLRNKMAILQPKGTDSVKTISSGLDKTDKLEFPHEGILFSDELFNLDADVMRLCVEGK